MFSLLRCTAVPKHPELGWIKTFQPRIQKGEKIFKTNRSRSQKIKDYFSIPSTIYFERAMATEVGEGGRLGMEVLECEVATLETVVGFMYGLEVPEGFLDLQGLLELGDRFLLEELKEEAGRRIAQHIDAQNFRWGLEIKPV